MVGPRQGEFSTDWCMLSSPCFLSNLLSSPACIEKMIKSSLVLITIHDKIANEREYEMNRINRSAAAFLP
jgi:hypothetical protein